jgi:hypothetical protein
MKVPYTSKPGKRAPGPTRSEAAIGAAVRDMGSKDSQMHTDPRIKRECKVCGALVNERCALERSRSGKAIRFAPDFCEGR